MRKQNSTETRFLHVNSNVVADTGVVDIHKVPGNGEELVRYLRAGAERR